MNDEAVPAGRIRASDAERNATLEALTRHAAEGRLTLTEHEERAGKALAATYTSELDELVVDLPQASEQVPARRSAPAWSLSVIGDTTRTGRWHIADEVSVAGGLGDRVFDLREATVDALEPTINVFNLIGDVTVFVPRGIDVAVSGGCLLGDQREYGTAGPIRAGTPQVSVHVIGLMGDVSVYHVTEEDRDVPLKRLARTVRRRQAGR